MVKLLGGRAAAAVIGFLMLAIGSSANAQDIAGSAASLAQPAVLTTATTVAQAPSVTVKVPAAVATAGGVALQGRLAALCDRRQVRDQRAARQQTNCLATAVYFEARGESVEGQLAVARVVMNRAASGRYPPDWCSVVKQPAQFSFVRHGEFPYADTNSAAWQKAEAVAELAAANVVPSVSNDVLWYHADYVAPTWRRSLQEVAADRRAHLLPRLSFD